jgi:hypothetical protein
MVDRIIELAAENDAVRQRLRSGLLRLDGARHPFPVGMSLARSQDRPAAVSSRISAFAKCPVCHSADLSASDTIAVCNDCEWIATAK